MIQTAKRLDSVEEYYFSKKLREVRQLISEGKPIVNMGIGSPDLQPSQAVIDAVVLAMQEENAHQYQSYQRHNFQSKFRVFVVGYFGLLVIQYARQNH